MKKYIALCFLIWLNISCSNFLEEYSQDLAKVENYTDLDELLLGDGYWYPSTVYIANSNLKVDGDYYLLPLHLMSDETEIFRKYNADDQSLNFQKKFFGYITWQRQVGQDYKTSTIAAEDKDWDEFYERINTVNQVIGNIDGQIAPTPKDALEKTRIKGEAHFLRAFYYFTLVNMYARPYDPATADKEPGVPVKLTLPVEMKDYESATLKEVYEKILADLSMARECLSQTTVKNHPYRADIVAAHLLTSRVALYMQDWQTAYNHADSVIRRKGQLEDLNTRAQDEPTNFLNRNSVETIFSMGGNLLAPGLYRLNGTIYGSVMNVPAYVVPENLVNAYGPENDDSDLRRGIFIRRMSPIVWDVEMSPVWVYNKVDGYRQYTNGRRACDVSDVFLMRSAEAYLNGAEAAAQLGKTEDATNLLRVLRSYRLKRGTTTDFGSDLVQFAREERERELCLEGHRWFDLRRYRVDRNHPFKKEIVHYYVDFQVNNNSDLQQTLKYVLPAEGFDDNYTLALPKEVTDFQNTLPSVSRRDIAGTVYNEWGDLTAIGREDGLKHGTLVGKEDMEAGNNRLSNYKNPRYDDAIQPDFSSINEYTNAYQAAFREAYEKAYPKAYVDGVDAGKKAAQHEIDKGTDDGYKEFFKDDTYTSESDKQLYKEGFDKAYGAYKEGLIAGKKAAQYELDNNAEDGYDEFFDDDAFQSASEKKYYKDGFDAAYNAFEAKK